jgi:hypothetical protein
MSRCDECRELILDHLYGLLEGPEAEAVEAHIAACPACAAARDEAARIQGLIGEAAKGSFPAVRFEAPAARPRTPAAQTLATQAQDRPATLPPAVPAGNAAGNAGGGPLRGRGTSRVGGFFPWAVAAAVLLAVPGTVYPVLGVLHRAEAARRDAESADAKAAAALREYAVADRDANQSRLAAHVRAREAQQAHDNLLARWVADEKAALQAQASRRLTWDLLKPAATQPGAPNEFLLVVRDTNPTPGGRIVAEFRDQTDAVVYSQPIDHERRSEHPIRLPASVWGRLTPQSELYFVVTREDTKTQEKTVLQEKIKLLGPVYATMLTTDRPTYRPGEVVRFRSLTLDRVTFTPPAREQVLHYELRGPGGVPVRSGAGKSLAAVEGVTSLVRVVKGQVTPVLGPDGRPVRGVGAGEFEIPADAADGEYTLRLQEHRHPDGHPPVVPFPVDRTFKVRSGASEAYAKQITFPGAASYSAGDTVEATVELKSLGEPVAGAKVHAVAEADGHPIEVAELQKVTDGEGKAKMRFALPEKLERGDVRLKVTFEAAKGQQTVEETVADRVPVVGRQVKVEFFPEGGDPVAGAQCRVYFRATTPTGQPADVRGTVTDGRRVLARASTVTDVPVSGANRGIGSFEFTPELDTPVWLQLDSPAPYNAPLLLPETGELPVAAAAAAGVPAAAGSRTGFLLPKPQIEGVVMKVPDPVTSPGQPIRVQLWSVGQTRNLVVGAYTRGRLSDTQHITVEPRRLGEVRLMAGTDPRGGVVRITVFEEPENADGKADLKPVAERLVFRRPGESLNLNFDAGDLPGGAVAGQPVASAGAAGTRRGLTVTATDEKGRPAAAILYAAAVNAATAPGPRDRLLTTHFLLAGEVNNPDAMEYADFLLTDHPKAAEALDLVLATQGWRRFAEQVRPGFARRPAAPDRDRAEFLTSNGQYLTMAEPVVLREEQRLRASYWPRYEEAVKNLDAAKAAARAAEEDHSAEERARELAKAAAAARAEAAATTERAAEAEQPVERFLGAGWYAVGGFGLLGVMLAAAGFVRPSGRLPFGIGSVGSVGLVVFLVVALGTAERTQAAAEQAEQVAKVQLPVPAAADPVPELAPAPRIADGVATGDAVPMLKSSEPPGRAKGGKDTFDNGMEFAKSGFGTSGARPGAFGAAGFGGGLGGGRPPGGGPAGLVPAAPVAPTVRPDPKSAAPPPKPEPKEAAGPGGGGPPGPRTTQGTVPAGPPAGAGGVPPALPLGGQPPRGGGWQPNAKAALASPDSLLPDRDRNDVYRLHTGAAFAAGLPPVVLGLDTKVREAAGASNARAEVNRYIEDCLKAQNETAEQTERFRRQITDALGRQLVREKAPGRPQAPAGRMGFARLSAEELALDRVKDAVPHLPPLVVREYAAPRPGSPEAEGLSFAADTVLWQPVIVLPSDGKTTLELNLGSASGYQVLVAGHTLDGRIGAVRGIISAAGPGGPAFAPSNSPPAQVTPPKP